jgi:hypothetical protein
VTRAGGDLACVEGAVAERDCHGLIFVPIEAMGVMYEVSGVGSERRSELEMVMRIISGTFVPRLRYH